MEGLVGSDTDSVGHGFNGSESPAGSTVGLISDFEEGFAFGPFGSGVEFFGEVFKGDNVLNRCSFFLGGLSGSEKGCDIIKRFESFVVSGNPVALNRVDEDDHLFREGLHGIFDGHILSSDKSNKENSG